MDGRDIIGAVASFQPFSEIESLADELGVVKQLCKELDAVISCSYDGILVTDGDGVIRKVNAATVKLLGLNPPAGGEVGREHHLGAKVAAKVRQDRKPCSVSCEVNGRQVALTGTPVFDENGAVVRIVTNVRDLSALSALKQELEEVNRLKEMYYSELSRLKTESAPPGGTFRSSAMERVYDLATRVAAVDTPVLVQGESGVGKEGGAGELYPRQQRPPRRPVHQDKLRGDPGNAAGVGAFRLHGGGVHRRAARRQAGGVRGRRRRDAVFGRDRRAAGQHPGEAAARAAGPGVF
jgi:transcriptional regulator with PAS, ATPase and Fis domain